MLREGLANLRRGRGDGDAVRFDGRPAGWVFLGPGSRHKPQVDGGRMNLIYFPSTMLVSEDLMIEAYDANNPYKGMDKLQEKYGY